MSGDNYGFRSKQFAGWMLVAVPAFTVVALVAEGLALRPWLAVALGMVLSEPLDAVRDWFIDWWEAEQEVESVAP